jgi:hypothetical protein
MRAATLGSLAKISYRSGDHFGNESLSGINFVQCIIFAVMMTPIFRGD